MLFTPKYYEGLRKYMPQIEVIPHQVITKEELESLREIRIRVINEKYNWVIKTMGYRDKNVTDEDKNLLRNIKVRELIEKLKWVKKTLGKRNNKITLSDKYQLRELRITELKEKYNSIMKTLDKRNEKKKLFQTEKVYTNQVKNPKRDWCHFSRRPNITTSSRKEYRSFVPKQDPEERRCLEERAIMNKSGAGQDLLMNELGKMKKDKRQTLNIDMTFTGRIDGTPFYNTTDEALDESDDQDGLSIYQLSYRRLPEKDYKFPRGKVREQKNSIKVHPNKVYNLPKENNASVNRTTPQKMTPQKITSQKITPQKITPQKITPQKITSQKITPQKITPQKTTPQKKKVKLSNNNNGNKTNKSSSKKPEETMASCMYKFFPARP